MSYLSFFKVVDYDSSDLLCIDNNFNLISIKVERERTPTPEPQIIYKTSKFEVIFIYVSITLFQ